MDASGKYALLIELSKVSYTMRFCVLAVFTLSHFFVGVTQARHFEVKRIDLYSNYWDDQDIVRALNTSKRYFLYGYSHQPSTYREVIENSLMNIEEKCISFKQEGLSATEVNITRRYEENDGNSEDKHKKQEDQVQKKEEKDGKSEVENKEKSDMWHGRFFKGPGVKDNAVVYTRDKANIIEIKKSKGTEGPTNYTLVYANYRNCLILRLLPKTVYTDVQYDPFAAEVAESTCFVLLDGPAAKTRFPAGCERMYKNACGERSSLKLIFQPTCKTDENILGC